MRFNVFAIFSILATATLAATTNPTYIVVLQTGAVLTKIQAILKLVPDVAAPGPTQQWSANGFTGFTVQLGPGEVKLLQASPDVSLTQSQDAALIITFMASRLLFLISIGCLR
jgi:hypothetical protein